jgi:parvulin-like peptidyl-prolyl isomerase
MMQENTDINVAITTDDVQAVMQSNPLMTLQVQNRALMRKLGEAHGEIARLTKELEQTQMELHDTQNDYASGRRDNEVLKEG